MAHGTDHKPLSRPQRERLNAILDRAERCFADLGYGATSMSAIAADLGYSKTTLWSRFPDKEQLFIAVLDRRIEGFAAAMDEALIAHDSVTTVLQRFGRTFLHKILSPETRRLRQLILTEGHRFPDLLKGFFARGPVRTRHRLAQHMSAEMTAGRLRPGDADLAAKQFIALVMARISSELMYMEPNKAIPVSTREVDEAVDTFLRAWGAPSPALA